MTNFISVMYDPEAADARFRACVEFIDKLNEMDRRHLVTDEAIDRWYSKKGPGPDLGPPVSPRLER